MMECQMECRMSTTPRGSFLISISPVFAKVSVFMKQYDVLQLYLTCRAFREGTLNIIMQRLIYSTFNFDYRYFVQYPNIEKEQYNRICKLSSLCLYKKYGYPTAITHLDITFERCNGYEDKVIDLSETLQSYINPCDIFTDFSSFQKLHTLSIKIFDGGDSKYLPSSLTDLTIRSVVNFSEFVFPSELVYLNLDERDCKLISPRQLPQKLKTLVTSMYHHTQCLLGVVNNTLFPESLQTLHLFHKETMFENDSGKQITIPGNVTTLAGLCYGSNYLKFVKPHKISVLRCNLAFSERFTTEIFISLFPNLQTLHLSNLISTSAVTKLNTKLDTYKLSPLIQLRKLSLIGTNFRKTAIHLSTSVIPPNLEYLDFEPVHADRVDLQHHTCLRFFVVHGDKPYVYNKSALPTSLEALYLIQTYPDASWISSWMSSTAQTFNGDGILLINSAHGQMKNLSFAKENDVRTNILPFECAYSKLPFDNPRDFLDSQYNYKNKNTPVLEEWLIQNIVQVYVLNQGIIFRNALKNFM